MVDGGVDGNDRVMTGLRDDFSVIFMVLVVAVAGSEPG